MSPALYKVSRPKADMNFEPTTFWRSPDWSSSSTREKPGYIADRVLYAGDFDEISIHLLRSVRRLRFWPSLDSRQLLEAFSLVFPPGVKAVLVADSASRSQVASFNPTIYQFEPTGFERVRNGEYVSRVPQTAVAIETLPFAEAVARWQFHIVYTDSYQEIATQARARGVYFEEQTAA